jgi:hypothetical protein
MTQRKDPPSERVIPTATWVTEDYLLKWPVLYRTQTIKKDLDKHMVDKRMMPTTDKDMLNKMVKK